MALRRSWRCWKPPTCTPIAKCCWTLSPGTTAAPAFTQAASIHENDSRLFTPRGTSDSLPRRTSTSMLAHCRSTRSPRHDGMRGPLVDNASETWAGISPSIASPRCNRCTIAGVARDSTIPAVRIDPLACGHVQGLTMRPSNGLRSIVPVEPVSTTAVNETGLPFGWPTTSTQTRGERTRPPSCRIGSASDTRTMSAHSNRAAPSTRTRPASLTTMRALDHAGPSALLNGPTQPTVVTAIAREANTGAVRRRIHPAYPIRFELPKTCFLGTPRHS